MAGRRNTTPLFEIMSRNGHGQAAPADKHAPAGRIEPKPDPSRPVKRPARPDRVPIDPTNRLHAAPEPDPVEIDEVEDAAELDDAEATDEAELDGAELDEGDDFEEQDGVEAPAAREAEPRDMPRTMGRMSVASGTLRLPVNYAYIALSVVFVAVLLAWTGGYVIGGSNANEKARREIESATGGGPLHDPLADAGIPAPGSSTPSRPSTPAAANRPGGASDSGRAPGASAPVATPGSPAAISAQRSRYLAPGGFYEGELRTPGLNYFCLVSRLPEEDAARALDFLARNSVPAMGFESSGSTANNRLFDLYTLLPIPSDGFRGSQTRLAHEAALATLGRRWKAEERGTSDFSRPQWFRYNP